MSEPTLIARSEGTAPLSFDRDALISYLHTMFGLRDLGQQWHIEMENDSVWIDIEPPQDSNQVVGLQLRSEGLSATQLVPIVLGILLFVQSFDTSFELDVLVPDYDITPGAEARFSGRMTVNELSALTARLL